MPQTHTRGVVLWKSDCLLGLHKMAAHCTNVGVPRVGVKLVTGDYTKAILELASGGQGTIAVRLETRHWGRSCELHGPGLHSRPGFHKSCGLATEGYPLERGCSRVVLLRAKHGF